MKIIKPLEKNRKPIAVAIFDFDGTISTLRKGWESIMEPLIIEIIGEYTTVDTALVKEIQVFIDESTGIQTIFQMEWIAAKVIEYTNNKEKPDPWHYKGLYNQKLLEMVKARIDKINRGEDKTENYRIAGSLEFVQFLYNKGVEIYIASGTDDVDLQNEIDILGLRPFIKLARGALYGKTDCSKERVIKDILEETDLSQEQLLILGDGKVEISLGNNLGAITIGTATDEEKLSGINPLKAIKLEKAGANAIIGDFLAAEDIWSWLKP